MAVVRLFVAVDPAPAVREALRAAVARVRGLAPEARWVDPEGCHVTLAFLGDLDAERVPEVAAAIGGVAARHAAIEARFGGAGTFGGRLPRVLWVGMTEGAAALGEVYRELAGALGAFGFAPEHGELTLHLTVARAGRRGGDAALGACAKALAGEDLGATRIEDVVLYQSELTAKGPRYTALARAPFVREG